MEYGDKVVALIRMKKAMLAELGFFALRKSKTVAHDVHSRQELLLKRIQLIDNWLLLLDTDELFVVEHHYIDGMAWPTLIAEYNRCWPEAPKAERTLMRKQAGAIEKIVFFAKEYENFIGYLLEDFPFSISKEVASTTCSDSFNAHDM